MSPSGSRQSVLPQHMGVFATTGMGKSNFMKTFCASCMKEQKFGLLIVDPHGEYVSGGKSSTGEPTKGLVHYTNGRDGLAIFTIRGEADRKKYAMNRLYLEYDDFRISDLSILHDLTAAQYDIIEAFSRAGGKRDHRVLRDRRPGDLPDQGPGSRRDTGRQPRVADPELHGRPGPGHQAAYREPRQWQHGLLPRSRARPCRRSSGTSMTTASSSSTSRTWGSGASSSSSRSSPG